MEDNLSDHDKLTTLVADVKNLKVGQDQFHLEMKEAFDDLKNNYKFRLDDHDCRIRDLETTRVDFRRKIADNKTYLIFLSAVGILLVGIMIFHITGYHI